MLRPLLDCMQTGSGCKRFSALGCSKWWEVTILIVLCFCFVFVFLIMDTCTQCSCKLNVIQSGFTATVQLFIKLCDTVVKSKQKAEHTHNDCTSFYGTVLCMFQKQITINEVNNGSLHISSPLQCLVSNKFLKPWHVPPLICLLYVACHNICTAVLKHFGKTCE